MRHRILWHFRWSTFCPRCTVNASLRSPSSSPMIYTRPHHLESEALTSVYIVARGGRQSGIVTVPTSSLSLLSITVSTLQNYRSGSPTTTPAAASSKTAILTDPQRRRSSTDLLTLLRPLPQPHKIQHRRPALIQSFFSLLHPISFCPQGTHSIVSEHS